jgi:hypothetical protein
MHEHALHRVLIHHVIIAVANQKKTCERRVGKQNKKHIQLVPCDVRYISCGGFQHHSSLTHMQTPSPRQTTHMFLGSAFYPTSSSALYFNHTKKTRYSPSWCGSIPLNVRRLRSAATSHRRRYPHHVCQPIGCPCSLWGHAVSRQCPQETPTAVQGCASVLHG